MSRNNEYMIECDVRNGIVYLHYLHEDKMKNLYPVHAVFVILKH